MTLIKERLPSCNAETLDSYLRGIGFFLLAGEVEPSVRAWWDEDGILWLASPLPLDELAAAMVSEVRHRPPPLRTPWRGSGGHGRTFVETRNDAEDAELDWLDACALARPAESKTASTARERSDRENNPLLGQGGSFGRSDPEAAYADALATIRRASDVNLLGDALVSSLVGEPLDRKTLQRLSTTKAVLGAYQSGRATGAGSSMRDVEPTRQPSRSSVWDIVLVLTGLRLFRGVPTRRADSRARVQASFPFLVRSRPIGIGPGGAHDLRADDPQAYELLAPLWSIPCTPRTLRRLVSSARLRLPPTRARQLASVAQDTLDAVLVQASRAAYGLGFERLVRFALVAGADPRYRFAVRRGEVHELGLRTARLALEEILPFLRELDRECERRFRRREDGRQPKPPSLTVARHRLDDALAAFGRPRPPASPSADAARTQEVLIALAGLQAPAARAVANGDRSFEPPRLESEWFRHADDGSAAYRLARSLVSGLSDGETCLLRETFLPQRRNDDGCVVLDASRSPPDLERVSDPLAVLVELVLTALRRTRPDNLPRSGSTSFSDLARLLSGVLGQDEERRLALLCAALAGIHPTTPPSARPEDPLTAGIGADIARLLLAAQPATEDETAKDAHERTTALASLLLAGRVDVARTMADRELRRRGLDLLPMPPRLAPTSRPAALALAVLLPFDEEARSALERVVSISPMTPHQQGGVA